MFLDCFHTSYLKLIQIPNPNDRLIPKIQSDEDKIRKVKTEIEKLDYRPSSRMFGAEGQLMTHMLMNAVYIG